MKYIKLTQGKKTIVDNEDFDYLNQWKWHFHNNGYAVRTINSGGGRKLNKTTQLKMHRVIVNTPKDFMTDHINGNRLDNRKVNLRICTNLENSWNARSYKRSRKDGKVSKYKGVYCEAGKWRSKIQYKGKKIHIGMFKSEVEAALAYNSFAKKLFGEYSRLNFI